MMPAGEHQLIPDGSALLSGAHVVRTISAGLSMTQPIVILR